MKIKRILILTPIAVFAVLLLSLCVASRHFENKRNQLVLSSSGDAERLNPILSTDSMSGAVCDLVFDALLKYNTDMELIPELASSFEVRQCSYCYPKDGDAALHTKIKARLSPTVFKPLGITGIHIGERDDLVIDLSTAGQAFEARIADLIPKTSLRPIHLTTVLLDPKYAFPDKTPCTAKAVMERLKSRLGKDLEVIEYFEENSGQIDIEYLADEQKMAAALKAALTNAKNKPFGKVAGTRTYLFDNEPSITFKLRKDVRWHDGEPFTSADVKFTYDKIMDEKTQTVRRPMFELVKAVDTPDPYTVVVTYKRPFAPCLESWAMDIIPKHLLDNTDINTSAFNRRPTGTGAFKFAEWRSDELISVVANDDYFQGRPALDRISWRIIPETSLRMLEFRTEGVDYDGVEPFEYEGMSKNSRFKVYERLSNAYTYIGWNQKRDIFKDKRVRRALTMAVNREEIVKYVLYDLGVVATGPFPPNMWYYNPRVKALPYDLEQSKALLSEAGWEDTDGDGFLDKDGKRFEFDLITNNGNQQRMDIVVLVQRQLKKLGIDVHTYLYEWSAFIKNKINPRDFEACILGWSLSYDPDSYEIWHSSQIEKGFNFTAYSNPEVDRLLVEGRTEFDREKRKQIYFKIHELIAEDQPYTFLYVPMSLPALHAGKFKIRRRLPDGAEKNEDIEMTRVGLTYYLERWYRVRSTEMAQ